MAQIGRAGQADISLLATQSVVVGSFGPGQTKVYTASPVVGQLPVQYTLNSVVTGGSLYLTFAAATVVRIEASPSSEVEYDFGAQPALTNTPFATTTGITARAGGGQALATPLTGNINRVTVCATAADSVLLPAAVAGRKVSLYNAGAAACGVFPQTGESINSGAANAVFSVGTTKSAMFECVTTGLWNALLGA